MGLFSKRTTDDEWIQEVIPLAKLVSKQWIAVSQASLFLSRPGEDMRSFSQEIAKQKSMAETIRRLPSPASPEASRIKSDYDSFLKDKIELEERRVEFGLAVERTQGGPFSSSDLGKTEKMSARTEQLEQTVRQLQWGGVEDFLNAHGIYGV